MWPFNLSKKNRGKEIQDELDIIKSKLSQAKESKEILILSSEISNLDLEVSKKLISLREHIAKYDDLEKYKIAAEAQGKQAISKKTNKQLIKIGREAEKIDNEYGNLDLLSREISALLKNINSKIARIDTKNLIKV